MASSRPKITPKIQEITWNAYDDSSLDDEMPHEYEISDELGSQQTTASDHNKYLTYAYDYQRAAAAIIFVAMFVIPGCEQSQF